MIYKNKKTLAAGSCMFCERGQVNEKNRWERLTYPYDYIYDITTDASQANFRICEDCLKELKKL